MKYRFIFNDYRPRRKCGPEIGVAMGIGSAFGGIVSSSMTNDMNATQSSINRAWQSGENQKQRDWETEEAQKTRDFNHDEAQLSRDFNQEQVERAYSEWYSQQDYSQGNWSRQQDRLMSDWYRQQEYNSPENQVARARAAGFNPSAVGASGGGLQDTSISVPTSQVPSGSTPEAATGGAPASSSTPSSSPVGAPSTIPMQQVPLAQMVEAAGNFMKNISQSDLNDVSKQQILEMLPELVRKLQNENKGMELSNIILDSTKDAKVQEAWKKVEHLGKLCSLVDAQEDTELFKQFDLYYDSFLKEAQGKVSNEIYEQYKMIKPYYVEAFKAEHITEPNARANQANAEAYYARQKGISENEFRKVNGEILYNLKEIYGSQKDILYNQSWITDKTKQSVAEKVISEAEAQKYITSKQAEELKKAVKDNEWYRCNMFFNHLSQTAGAFRDAGIGLSGFGSALKPSTSPVQNMWNQSGSVVPAPGYGLNQDGYLIKTW